VGSSVIGGDDVFETVLSCCIPELQFDDFAIELKSGDFEVDSDCGLELGVKSVVDVSEKH